MIHVARLLHEENVEKFYSRGSDTRALQEDGFLSFGYWTKDTRDYFQAAEDLLDHVVGKEVPLHRGTILNVACGYGAETFRIYDRLQPDKIVAIDITQAHVQHANKVAAERKISEHVNFKKMDACQLPFDACTFAYVIAIEGPAHFKSRKLFLEKAYNCLEPNGVLLLSDIIVNSSVVHKNLFNRWLSRLCSKHWRMPMDNWMSVGQFEGMLNKIGFEETTVKSVGGNVYPGFAQFNMKFSSIVNAIRTRGLRLGIGLTFISWLLGFLYHRGIVDYVLVRAAKNKPRPVLDAIVE